MGRPRKARGILLKVAYDGTSFKGWQIQPNVRTVQGELSRCLTEMEKEPVRVRGASRTDAGVHALGQIASFWSRHDIPLRGYIRGLNALLDADMAVLEARYAPDSFDLRHWPIWKLYRYTIYESPIRDPFMDRYALRVPARLDDQAMASASVHLVGRHDFSAFRAADPNPRNPVRTIYDIRVLRSGNLVHVDVRGKSFLKYMVRSIVGTLLRVGTGDRPPSWVAEVLESRERRNVGPTAPPKGLCLVHVALRNVAFESPTPSSWPLVSGPLVYGPPEMFDRPELGEWPEP